MLKGKVCLITGGNRGIGAATVQKFAKEHAIVYASARKKGSIDLICRELCERYQTQVIPLYFDVTNESEAKNAIMTIKKQQDRLDVLVNNAGIMQDALIGMVNRSLMQSVFDVNVFAVMNMIQLANKLMSRGKNGSIINLTSIVGVEGSAGQMVYSASKGAVIAITKTAAKELAVNNIRVNAIAPGMIDTDMVRGLGKEKIEENLEHIGLGRLGRPEDVANAIAFLASDDAEYITGQILGVDGETCI